MSSRLGRRGGRGTGPGIRRGRVRQVWAGFGQVIRTEIRGGRGGGRHMRSRVAPGARQTRSIFRQGGARETSRRVGRGRGCEMCSSARQSRVGEVRRPGVRRGRGRDRRSRLGQRVRVSEVCSGVTRGRRRDVRSGVARGRRGREMRSLVGRGGARKTRSSFGPGGDREKRSGVGQRRRRTRLSRVARGGARGTRSDVGRSGDGAGMQVGRWVAGRSRTTFRRRAGFSRSGRCWLMDEASPALRQAGTSSGAGWTSGADAGVRRAAWREVGATRAAGGDADEEGDLVAAVGKTLGQVVGDGFEAAVGVAAGRQREAEPRSRDRGYGRRG